MAVMTQVQSEGDQDGGEFREWNTQAVRTPLQVAIYKFIHATGFELALTGLVILNVAFIMIDTDASANGEAAETWQEVLSYCFLSFYTVELLLRLYVLRMSFFVQAWNLFDFIIVLADYLMLFLNVAFGDMPSVGFLRVIRLARLARSARMVMLCPQLALMVKGMLHALSVIAWSLLLIVVALILFAILAVQILHPVNVRVAEKGLYEHCERCPRAFSSVWMSILTFVQQIITGDSWGTISLPIIEESPATAIFFVVVFGLLELMILNVVLSLVVETSSKAAQEDSDMLLKSQEREFEKSAQKLKMLCRELDHDGSGSLTSKELIQGFDNVPAFKTIMSLMQIGREDCEAVFNILDQDGSGDIDYEEFIKELYKMKSHDEHTMLVFMKYYVIEIKKLVSSLNEHFEVPLKRAGSGVQGTNSNLGKSPKGPHSHQEAHGRPGALAAEKKLEGPSDVERELLEAVNSVQKALREELFASVREIIVQTQEQARALNELKGSLPRDPSIGGIGMIPPFVPSYDMPIVGRPARGVNVPGSRCCQFEDGRQEANKISRLPDRPEDYVGVGGPGGTIVVADGSQRVGAAAAAGGRRPSREGLRFSPEIRGAPVQQPIPPPSMPQRPPQG